MSANASLFLWSKQANNKQTKIRRSTKQKYDDAAAPEADAATAAGNVPFDGWISTSWLIFRIDRFIAIALYPNKNPFKEALYSNYDF